MQRILLSILSSTLHLIVQAQSPEKMSYQSVVRDENNSLLVNQPIGMRVSILQGDLEGTSVYSETHSVNTNANGLASLEIGGGTVLSGVFENIDWANGPYFILTEVDIDGGVNYTITSTSQLMSVPYALYAKNAGSSTPGPQGEQGPPGPGLSDGNIVNQMLYWNGSSWTQLDPGNNGQMLTLCDGELIWTNGNCPGIVQSLNCNGISVLGVLEQNIFTESVIISVPYSGGNGQHYEAVNFNSTGVEGFSAQLVEGDFNTGDGVLYLQVSGATESIGTATFEINIGGQSCAVNVQVNPLLAGPTDVPPVGSYYQGGILAYIFTPSDFGYIEGEIHGIVVAEQDQIPWIPWLPNSTGVQWGCQGSMIPGGTNVNIGFGSSNSNNIDSFCTTPSTAADICSNLESNGYNDWFLPSVKEIEAVKDFLTDSSYYWSSSEYNSAYAWATLIYDYQAFSGYQFFKNTYYAVRAIRYF